MPARFPTMMSWATVIAVLLSVSAGTLLQADDDTPVFKSLKYGIFVTHGWGGTAYALSKNPDLSVPTSIDAVADAFDVPKFVHDLQSFRSDYVTFAVWHACMNPLFPSAAMQRWRGPGHACKRDVLGELITALRPTGIKLFLYIHPSDGHDMTRADQDRLGWNESDGNNFAPGKFVKWNNFMNDVVDEMCARYGKDVCGYWIDGGWAKVDKDRLEATVRSHNAKAEFVSGMDNAGWCSQFNAMCPPDPAHGVPVAVPIDADTWPCFETNANLLEGGCWWSTGGSAKVSPVGMLRYTVLQAGANTRGGGVGWAADPYTDGSWEPNVREYLSMLGTLIKPIEESIKNTLPSTSFITLQGSRIATLATGCVATHSLDGKYEYIHVLRPPTTVTGEQAGAYQTSITLPLPADGAVFTNPVMLRTGNGGKISQDAQGVHIGIPAQDCWDPVDTVIRLTCQPGYGLLSSGQPVTMSGPEVPGWEPRNAVDGTMDTCWSSPAMPAGEKPWITIDLGAAAEISRVHLYPRIAGAVVGYNFPVDLQFSVSLDGVAFTTVDAVTGYTVTSPRSQTRDLALTAVGRTTPSEYPQYFPFPAKARGRYLRITGVTLKDEQRMQFAEVQVYGSR